jgi:type II secretory pathway component PulK
MTTAKARTEAGFALMATLAVMTVLSVLAASFVFTSRAESKVAAFARSQSQAYYTARAGIHRAAAAVREHSRDKMNSVTADWFTSPDYRRVAFGDQAYSLVRESGGTGRAYGLDDEESRLNVNLATPEMLMRLPGMTNLTAEAVVAYVAQKKAAEEDRRALLGLPDEKEGVREDAKDKPVTGPVRELGELLGVPGLTRELLFGDPAQEGRGGLAEALTCYSSGKVNVNTARPLTLAALGLSKRQIKAVLALRADGFPGFLETGEFTRVLAQNASDGKASGYEDSASDNGPAPSGLDDLSGLPEETDQTAAAPPAKMLDVKSRNFRITALALDENGVARLAIRSRLSLGEDDMRFTMFSAHPAGQGT